jgi:hypothetical protein
MMLPLLIWFLASPHILLGCFAIDDKQQAVAVGVFSKV